MGFIKTNGRSSGECQYSAMNTLMDQPGIPWSTLMQYQYFS